MVNYVKSKPMGNGMFLIKPGAGVAIPHSDNSILEKATKGSITLPVLL
jgi:hypothetical protein